MAFREIFEINMDISVDYWDFNIDNFNKAVFDHGNRLIRKAGQAFCEVLVHEVPVWSGMALASLRPLARAVRFALPIVPVEGAPDRRALGESMGRVVSTKTAHVTGTANIDFEFNWSTLVEHFNINEQVDVNTYVNPKTGVPYFNLKKPGPWGAIEKAQLAAEMIIDYGVETCPKPTDHMVKKHLNFNPKYNEDLGTFVRVLDSSVLGFNDFGSE